MIGWRAFSIIPEYHARYLLIHVLRVPEALGWNGQYQRLSGEGIFLPRPYPTEERRPGVLCLLARQTLKQHSYVECIVGAEVDLLAPVGIKQMRAIKAHRLADQSSVGLIGRGSNRRGNGAKELGQFPRAQRESRDDTEGAASAALDCPEQIRI